MAFHWHDDDDKPLAERFNPETLGYKTWCNFVATIFGTGGWEIHAEALDPHERLLAIFSRFLHEIDAEVPEPATAKMRYGYPVVFVSHRRSDVLIAERIAHLACNHGIDYWLDVHDPVLSLANLHGNHHLYPIIVAAIIEIALLNSTHLIAVHSLNSAPSKWVPYELGRVRDRRIRSSNTGGWFHPDTDPDQCGGYVQLCRIARGGEQPVTSWLANWRTGRTAPQPWPSTSTTTPLPTRQ